MTMVYETRKVVEDYVLYKIKQHRPISLTTNGMDFVSSQMQQRLTVHNYAHFPLPQDPPSEINRAVRKVADDYEERYKKAYPDLLDGVRASHIASCNIDKVFSKITQDLFQMQVNARHRSITSSPSGGRKSKSPALGDTDSLESQIKSLDDGHIKWGHVIGLLVFTGILAVRCVEINNNEQVDEIVNWVSKFFDTRLGPWLRRHGGWRGFAEWYHQGSSDAINSWFDNYQIGQGMRTALRIGGAVAALALGAAMLSRK